MTGVTRGEACLRCGRAGCVCIDEDLAAAEAALARDEREARERDEVQS